MSKMAASTQPQEGHLSLIILLKMTKLGALKGTHIAHEIERQKMFGAHGIRDEKLF